MIRLSGRAAKGGNLVTVLERQFFLLRSGVRDERTRAHYRRTFRWLNEMLGREARLSDLTDDHLAGLMNWLAKTRKQSAETINTSHKCFCAFWRWCRDRGLVATGPTIPKLRTVRRIPRAWSEEELRRLMLAATQSQGSIGGYPASIWWTMLLAIEWDTGARSGELLALRWEWLDMRTGWLHVPGEVRKGRQSDAVYALLPDTLRFLKQYAKPQGLILGWTQHYTRYYQHWRALLKRAGLPDTRYTKTQALRRSFGSWLAVGGGDATAALGHSDRQTTIQHYLDPSLTQQRYAERLPFRILPQTGDEG